MKLCLRHTLKLIEELQSHGITQESFAFAQESLINRSGFMYNTPQKRIENLLLEKTLKLPPGFMKTYAVQLQSVTFNQVNAALQVFIKPDQLTIAVLGTASELKEALAESSRVPPKEIKVINYTQP